MKNNLLLLLIAASSFAYTTDSNAQNARDNDWTLIKGKLRSVAAGNASNVWGIGLDFSVWKYEDGSFKRKKGLLESISVGGDGSLWGVGVHSGVHKWENDKWVKIPGALTQVSVGDADNIWGIDDGNNVWRRQADKWVKIDGAKAKWISVGHDGTVWCVQDDATVWKWSGSAFKEQKGELKKVVVQNADRVWGLNFHNQPVIWTGTEWKLKYEGAAEDLSVGNDGSVWAVKANGNVYRIE